MNCSENSFAINYHRSNCTINFALLNNSHLLEIKGVKKNRKVAKSRSHLGH